MRIALRRLGCAAAVVVVAAAAAALIAGLVWWVREVRAEQRRLAGLYWYDVTADHRYDPSAARHVPLELDDTGFADPDPGATADTALLRVAVESDPKSDWYEPWIEVEGPSGSRVRQYLARRGRGTRYVNLGGLLAGPRDPGGRFTLRGGYVSWTRQAAELLLFHNESPAGRRLLVLAPHPDDAEIAAYALYAAGDSWIVTVSTGGYDDRRLRHLYDDAAERARAHGLHRTWDSLAVPLLAGVPPERCVNLGFANGSLADLRKRRDETVPEPVTGSTDLEPYRGMNVSSLLEGRDDAQASWDGLVADLETLLARIDPEVIVAPHPVLDAASDHRLSTAALSEALARARAPELTLLLYTNHLPLSEYWPYGPADSIVSLPPWLDGRLPVRGVLSFPVDEATRAAKLFALDAMHDLRPAPRFAPVKVWDRVRGELGRKISELRRDRADQYSYFRRAVRPNELFLAHTTADLPALLEYLQGMDRPAAGAGRAGPTYPTGTGKGRR